MGCGREPKAILLARVAVAKRIAIRQCIPDNIHSKAILFLLSTPSTTIVVPLPLYTRTPILLKSGLRTPKIYSLGDASSFK